MRLPIISDALQAIAEGFDLAFEIMCPRDHSCEYRARKAREAQRQAAADALADAEAEREAWEANELFDRAVVGGQNFRTCPVAGVCAHKGFCDQLDDCCIRAADLNTSRAEGTQRADSSGEVGGHESPSPERPDVLRQVARQIWLYLDDGCRERLIVALALIEPPEPEGS